MKLLIPEPPLQVLPTLAKEIGLNEAIVVQQLHYWSLTKEPDDRGEVWVYNTLAEWLEQFPWLSEATLRRVIARLKKRGLIEVKRQGQDRTNHYRIDYDRLPSHAITVSGPSDQGERLSNTTETTQERKSAASTSPTCSDEVRSVWDHYIALFPSPRGKGLTPKRISVIEKALAEFTVDELRRALDGAKAWRKRKAGGTDIADFLTTNLKSSSLTSRISWLIDEAEKHKSGAVDDDLAIDIVRREQDLD